MENIKGYMFKEIDKAGLDRSLSDKIKKEIEKVVDMELSAEE